jgi:hypothetical protein
MKTNIHNSRNKRIIAGNTNKELANLLKKLQLKEKSVTEEQLNKAVSRLLQTIRKT